MNTKNKSKKGKEKGIIGITLAAIMIASIFAAIVPVTTAIEHTIAKNSLESEHGAVNDSKTYHPGDTVYYRGNYTPNSEAVWLKEVRDNYPDGSSVVLFTGNVSVAKDETYSIEMNWTIPLGWSASTINNQVVFNITSQTTGNPDSGTASAQNDIIFALPVFDITWEQICCKNISFNGSASNASSGFKNHTWDFDHGTPITKNGAPGVITHLYSSCGPKDVNLSGYDNDGNFNSTVKHIWVDCGPVASAKASPFCYEADGTQITFDSSASHGDPLNPFPRDIIWWKWTFSDGGIGPSDNAENTSRKVNATLTATLEVSDGCCNATTTVTVKPCSMCKLRIYGTYGEGPGYSGAIDPVTGLKPENLPYSDPVGPFHPQNTEAPRKDFITFNPAIMDHNQNYSELVFEECVWPDSFAAVERPKEKVFKRMWYEKEWFKDENSNGCWDVVIEKYDTITGKWKYETTMCLVDWNNIPDWEKNRDGLRIREWNSPGDKPAAHPDWKYIPDADIYGPAINQEFTYMFLNSHTEPIMIRHGSEVLIPMAHQSTNAYSGLNSFDADGDGDRDVLIVESEATLGLDIDHDGIIPNEPMDMDNIELNGNESVVLVLRNMSMGPNTRTIQLFDHRVTLEAVWDAGSGTGAQARFKVCDNEGGRSQRCTENVMMTMGETTYFHRAKLGSSSGKETFYLKVTGLNIPGEEAIVEVGRMFGQTYANIGSDAPHNPYWSQKAFMVDGVFYNVVAIKAHDDCIKYITFRQKLPKMPIKLYGKHLTVWNVNVLLPEMSPFNMNHEVIVDVYAIDPTNPPYLPIVKVGPKEPRPALEITYTKEDEEERYKGELKELYMENYSVGYYHNEWWDLEWFHTKPQQYTEFRLPRTNNTAEYLVTLSWIAPESEITLWDGGNETDPVANYTRERVKFWYQDCSGPLYIDANQSSIRLFGTFNEGPGNLTALDPITGMKPENSPYTDPMGPFWPQNSQAPRKDFMTFNPAIMDHNQGYPELDFERCLYPYGSAAVEIPKEKVFKRMWYEKEWFKDEDSDGKWDVVIEHWDSILGKWVSEPCEVMTLAEWNAIPDWQKLIDKKRLREWNSPYNKPAAHPDWEYCSEADIYGPAINQEFTYMSLDSDTMPIMIQHGSEVLIPMAHNATDSTYRGLNSFDADGDGERDVLRVESEWTLDIDVDQNGRKDHMDRDVTELNGNESVVLVLKNKEMISGGTIQLFDHIVTLKGVWDAGSGTGAQARFTVCDNEGATNQRCEKNVMMTIADNTRYFYRGRINGAERETFYLKVVALDIRRGLAIVEMGRMFGQTHANIGSADPHNPYWSQKAFMVDGVFYNVVAIKAHSNDCIKYITFRQKLPKMPIKLYGKQLKVWGVGETLPEMSPFNLPHEIIVDVQSTWTRPYTQQDKIGDKKEAPALNITYVEEDVEERFYGELKEIYNETHNMSGWPDEEYWNVEWFHTKPEQYTAFVMPKEQGLYLMTLAWLAPEAEITIWNHNPDGPVANYTRERVKFWYDPADNTDIYVNRVGEDPSEDPAWMSNMTLYYGMAAHGGNGDDIIDTDEVINAIMNYLDNAYPFGPTGPGTPFDKLGLIGYILDYLAQP